MPKQAEFQFHAQEAERWWGRYSRIEGTLSVFNVVSDGGQWVMRTYMRIEQDTISCEPDPCPAVERMLVAINHVKTNYHGQAGGSFQINEYGQVLVPTEKGKRFYVGWTTGVMPLRNLDTGQPIDLSDDAGLATGDPWELPYVGLPYNLSRSNQIYHKDDALGGITWSQHSNWELIRKLRSVRRTDAVRFIVNPHGLVLTKMPTGEFNPDDDRWTPVYVGRLNYAEWFGKESVQEWQTGS